MKKLRYLYILPGLLLFILLFTGFLIGTESGLKLIHKALSTFAGEVIAVEKLQGRLLGRIVAKNLRLRTASLDIDLKEAEFSWRPSALFKGIVHIHTLHLDDATVLLKGGDEPETDSEVETTIPKDLMGIGFKIEDLRVTGVQLVESDDAPFLSIDLLIVTAEGDNAQIKIDELSLQTPDFGVVLQGQAEPHDTFEEWKLDLEGRWRLAGFGFHPMAGEYRVAGPLEKLDVKVVLKEPGDIRVHGTLNNLLVKPEWVATVEARDFGLSTWILSCPEIKINDLTGDLYGDFGNYYGNVVSDLEWAMFDNLRLSSELDGDGLGIIFNTLRIDRNNGFARADGGSISWAELFSWKADIHVENFNPAIFTDSLPGNLNGEIKSVGDVTEEGLTATFGIDYIDGLLHDVAVSLEGKLLLDENGIYSDELIARSGEIGGEAQVSSALFTWDERSAWSGDVVFDKFEPAILHPQLYGEVSGSLSGAGTWSQNGILGAFELAKFSGQLRGNQLSGGGRLSVLEGGIESTGFILTVGSSVFEIEGGVGEDVALGFNFQSPALEQFFPLAKGALSVHGDINGSKAQPVLNVEITGNGLGYDEYSVSKVSSSLQALLTKGTEGGGGRVANIEGKLELASLQSPGFTLERSTVQIEGSDVTHTINAVLQTDAGTATINAIGGYDRNDSLWQGELYELSLNTQEFGNWNQFESSQLQVAENGVNVSHFCLKRSGTSDRGCFEAGLSFGEPMDWSMEANLESMGFELLNKQQVLPYRIDGTIGAHLSLAGTGNHLSTGKGWLELPLVEVVVHEDDEDDEKVVINDSLVRLELVDEALETTGRVQVKTGGEMLWSIQLTGIQAFDTPLTSVGLQGDLELSKLQLTMLDGLAYLGVQPKGALSGALSASGSLAEPKIVGDLAMEDGGIELSYQGIVLEDIYLSLEATGENTRVRGRVESGDGYFDINGTMGYDDNGGWGDLQLTGNNFQLVNLPEYSFRVNPDVNFSFSGERGELTGRVNVPYGLIVPEELRGTVNVSEDVVLVDHREIEEKSGWPFYLDLNVILGEDVSIDGYGLSGHLGGNFKVKIAPDDLITGLGELDLLDGKFSLYGRSFDIERGRVLFTGGPIDNPGVDVRAQKVVSAEKSAGKGYTVGVDISGLVQDLQFQLFSDPYMDDTEILSHLILGHSLAGSNEEEGNLLQVATSSLGLAGGSKLIGKLGNLLPVDDMHLEGSAQNENVSFVVGKKITEDLYIGYDINMFSQLGQFRVRYDLKRGFWVETSSSSESTGADLMYSFER